MRRLSESGVRVMKGTKVSEVKDGGVVVLQRGEEVFQRHDCLRLPVSPVWCLCLARLSGVAALCVRCRASGAVG